MPSIETYGTIQADGKLAVEQTFAGAPRKVKVRVDELDAESDEEFAKRFARLAATWHEETRFDSKMGKAAEHPAYQEIIAMGERVVPLLLADLEKGPQHWFIALSRITGAKPPLPKEDAGRIQKMADAWLAWGREKGYRWERAV